jgi:putative ABC transport system substrate-binding protein
MVFPGSAKSTAFAETAFWGRMRELGWTQGTNITAAIRYADGQLERFPSLTAQVLAVPTDVMVAAGTQAVQTAKSATSLVPIVGVMADPVGVGLVESLARPGGNITGVSIQIAEEIPTKWVELLVEAVPGLNVIAVIVNPNSSVTRSAVAEVSRATKALGLRHVVIGAGQPGEYARAIEQARKQAQAAIVIPDGVAIHSRHLIAQLAERHRLPIMAATSEFVEAGALMAYGPNETVTWRRVAEYVDRILRGAKPHDLPIQQPTEFRLTINLKTAKAFRLAIPESLLSRADEVIR